MIGRALSHYRVIRALGTGGMGEVYLAEDTLLDRHVALKLLRPEHTKDQERLRRFKQEAKAASALNHPNILTIYEFGEADGHQFIATEFVDGETLRESLRRAGRMETSAALNVAVQVASALVAAHGAGIVHRDIKPENIMVRRDGYLKVVDFGLAKLIDPDPQQFVDTTTPTATAVAHTAAGVVLGTAPYMSPEQASGKTTDARSDIFSFGAVCYELVAGERAFQGDSLIATLAAAINLEPKPLPAKVPPALAEVIMRCLRKDPGRRYQTMADLHVVLEDLREGSRATSHARPRATWLWAAAAMLVLLVGALAMWPPWRGAPDSQPLLATAITTFPGVELYPSFSPDGNHLAFTWTGPKQDNQDIYVQMIGSGSPLRLTTDPSNDYNSVWSPDGRWIAFLRSQPTAPSGPRSRELRLVPSLGGPERKLADIRSQDFFPAAAYLAWSPDSTSVLVTDSAGEGQPDALFVVSLATGQKQQLTHPPAAVLADTSPAVSPDGRSLVFLRRTSWGAGELHVLPVEGSVTASGEPRRITSADLRADFPAWVPDGQEIVFSARGGLWRLDVRGDNAPTRLPYVGADGMMPAISSGAQAGKPARLVYARSYTDWNFWRLETSAPGAPATTPPVLAISSTSMEYHSQFSPDGRLVAFASIRSGDPEIWVSKPDGSDAVALTAMRAVDTNCPRWSPDGQQVAFSSTAAGEFDIYVVSAAGGEPHRLTSHAAIDLCPSFSRDGQWIYFNSVRSGDYRTWKMRAAGGDAVLVTPHHSTWAFETVDGRTLYYLTASVDSPVWRMPTSGGKPVQVLSGIVWFNFWLFDKGAYYIDKLAGETRLQYFDLATGRSTTVARHLGEVGAGLTATPDGRTIIFTRVDAAADDLMLVDNFR